MRSVSQRLSDWQIGRRIECDLNRNRADNPQQNEGVTDDDQDRAQLWRAVVFVALVVIVLTAVLVYKRTT